MPPPLLRLPRLKSFWRATEAAFLPFPPSAFPPSPSLTLVLVAIRASDVLGGEAGAEAALDDGADDRGKLRRRRRGKEEREPRGRFWF